MKVDERPFTLAEVHEASEAFATSASGFANPIVEMDGKPVGDGKPGPVAGKLREIYIRENMKAAV